MPVNTKTLLLDDGEVYDLIVDVVGDETSLEFCVLVDYYLEGRDLDAALEMNGLRYTEVRPLIDEVEARAADRRGDGPDGDAGDHDRDHGEGTDR